jgi:hypothetical protein
MFRNTSIESKVLMGMRIIDILYAIGFAITISANWLPSDLTREIPGYSKGQPLLIVALGITLLGLTWLLIFNYEKERSWARSLLMLLNYAIIVFCTNNIFVFVRAFRYSPEIAGIGITVEVLAVLSSIFFLRQAHQNKWDNSLGSGPQESTGIG